MTGYQEIFTDPSYYGQLMMMTYPHIGNYGTSARDDEARHVMIAGLIIRSFSWDYSNPMADGTLNDYLIDNNITGITGVDTRKLVRHIRTKGVMNAIISSTELDEKVLIEKARSWVSMSGLERLLKSPEPRPRPCATMESTKSQPWIMESNKTLLTISAVAVVSSGYSLPKLLSTIL